VTIAPPRQAVRLDELPDLLTTGDLHRLFPSIPKQRIAYALDIEHIEPKQRAGIIRLYAKGDLARIKSALIRVAGRRS
jgi:hypothetical protein